MTTIIDFQNPKTKRLFAEYVAHTDSLFRKFLETIELQEKQLDFLSRKVKELDYKINGQPIEGDNS